MRSPVYKSVVLLVVWLMVPGARELVVEGVHALAWGHTSHDESIAHHEEGPGDEHGCSGSFHACACHAAPQVVIAEPTVMRGPDIRFTEAVQHCDTPAPSAHRERLFRPPSA